jgi:hypothetical protein
MNRLVSEVQWLVLMLFTVLALVLIVVGAVHARREVRRRRAAEASRRAEREAAIRRRLQAPLSFTTSPEAHSR